jgi:hypothetical protein
MLPDKFANVDGKNETSKSYEAPRLIEHGPVEELTQGPSSTPP